MNTADASLDERIRSFAASVRAHLDDLPAEDAEDITTGLVADLVEKAADNGGAIDLDDPAAYAEELRLAAGLPSRSAAARSIPLGVRFSTWRSSTAASIRRSAFGAGTLDLLITLRPVWWVLRGAAIYAVLLAMTGRTWGGFWPEMPLGWLALAGITLVSVQWGRGRWLPENRLRHVRTAVSVVAVIALPFAFVWMATPHVEYYDEGYYPQDGLMLDGAEVGNIFAYDAEGNLLPEVQLFTEDGTPLDLIGANRDEEFIWSGGDDETVTVPLRDFRDQPIWNVYPLQEASMDDWTGEVEESTLAPAEAPFERATPVARQASPTPTPTPTDGRDAPEPETTPEP